MSALPILTKGQQWQMHLNREYTNIAWLTIRDTFILPNIKQIIVQNILFQDTIFWLTDVICFADWGSLVYSARALCKIRIILQKEQLQNSRIFWLVCVTRKGEEGKEVKGVKWKSSGLCSCCSWCLKYFQCKH